MSTSEWRADAELAERLEAFARMRSSAGIFTDFDGSLSPIVADPDDARPVRGAGRALNELARSYAVVAVISGRPVSFLVRRLHARGVRYVGLYGVEERVGRTLNVLPEVRAARSAIDRAAQRLELLLSDVAGILIEHKGLAVSVHFRRTDDPAATMERARATVEQVAAEEGLAPATRGKLVLEVGPRVSTDKGAVVRRLVASTGIRAALAIGDDVGDIAMFDAMDDLDLAIRVAVGTSETPAELVGRADVLVRSPDEAVQLLRSLASASGR